MSGLGVSKGLLCRVLRSSMTEILHQLGRLRPGCQGNDSNGETLNYRQSQCRQDGEIGKAKKKEFHFYFYPLEYGSAYSDGMACCYYAVANLTGSPVGQHPIEGNLRNVGSLA